MKRKLTTLAMTLLLLLFGFAVLASANTVDHAGGPWISTIVGGSGTSSARYVSVRLSFWGFPPGPTTPNQPREWVPVATQTVPTRPNGLWGVSYDVHAHPAYWDWIDCPPIVRGWAFGRYKLDLFVHSVFEDSREFFVAHDCFERPPTVPPGAPPRLPIEP